MPPVDVAVRPVPGLDLVLRVESDGALVTRVALEPAGATPDGTRAAKGLAAEAADRVAGVLAGASRDSLADVPLAWETVTPFQRKVLTALREHVPRGRTVTYADLCQLAGFPAGSARAVGGACAANPWLVVVPCHRVLPQGGGLGNYAGAGGVTTKGRLLALEGAAPRRLDV